MAGVQEENRLRIALVLVSLGAILIIVGVILGFQHYHPVQEAPVHRVAASGAPVRLDRQEQARLIRHILFLLLVLMSILIFSLYAFRLWSRRYRQMLLRKPAPATPSEDVWAMHRLPEEQPPGEAGPAAPENNV